MKRRDFLAGIVRAMAVVPATAVAARLPLPGDIPVKDIVAAREILDAQPVADRGDIRILRDYDIGWDQIVWRYDVLVRDERMHYDRVAFVSSLAVDDQNTEAFHEKMLKQLHSGILKGEKIVQNGRQNVQQAPYCVFLPASALDEL